MERDTRQANRARTWGPDELDEHGHYLYPGDVEDAMPEGNKARRLATYLQETILRCVAAPERDSAYANLPIYTVRGNPRKHVSPDAFYLVGVPYEPDRVSYRLWETGVAPRAVFEILSQGSEIKDRVANRRIYEDLGIPEYYWFGLQTHELQALELEVATGRYRERVPDDRGQYRSAVLGLDVGVREGAIALYRDGAWLPPTEELLAAAERQKAEAERQKAEAERQKAEAEQRLAEAAARIRELEERLRRGEGKDA